MTGPADYEDGDVNVLAEDYEDGDINVAVDEGDELEGDDLDALEDDEYEAVDSEEYESGDINARGPGGIRDDPVGNRPSGGMPGAVLGYLARSLANEPGSVVVNVEERHGAVRLRLHVAQEDMGRVIGRRGRTAQAIRTLVGVAGARDGVQTSVDIVDD